MQTKEVETMENQHSENRRFSTEAEMILGAVIIIVLLIVSGFLANAIKDNSARQASSTMAQNRLSTMILTIKADIAESMLPAHDYLILPSSNEKREFQEMNEQIEMDFNILQIDQHFEPIDHKLIDEAFDQFKKLRKVEEEILALPGDEIQARGAQKMRAMHVYQSAILNKFGALNNLELTELEALIMKEQEANHRSVTLITFAALLALGAALAVGYLGSKI